jgi:hypothetical protein
MELSSGDTQALEDMAGYVVRNPLSLKRLVYIDGQQAVICRALKPNPSLGRNFVAMDPLERPQPIGCRCSLASVEPSGTRIRRESHTAT